MATEDGGSVVLQVRKKRRREGRKPERKVTFHSFCLIHSSVLDWQIILVNDVAFSRGDDLDEIDELVWIIVVCMLTEHLRLKLKVVYSWM